MAKPTTADVITSRENRWVKLFRAGLRGTGPSGAALRLGLEAEAVLVSESGERHLENILRAASDSETGIARSRVLRTTDKIFESASGTEAPQGVAALFRQPTWDFAQILGLSDSEADSGSGTSAPLVLVIAGVQDPGNVGTIVGSAEAFGATGVVAGRGTADPWSPKALRASAVSALRLPLLRGIPLPVLLAQLKMAQVKIIAASGRGLNSSPAETRASRAYPDLRDPSAIFVGNEGAGLAPEVLHSADGAISIPIHPSVDSLNAGVAASIALFEAARQRSLVE